MRRQIYWGVVQVEPRARTRIFPFRLWQRAYYAKKYCREQNEFESQFKKPKKYIVERFLLEFKEPTHYDVYKHEVKRI